MKEDGCDQMGEEMRNSSNIGNTTNAPMNFTWAHNTNNNSQTHVDEHYLLNLTTA